MLPPIIPPVDVELLKSELNDNTFLRTTNRGDNEIYVVNNENAPNVLREIGRLREVSFRAVGGGSGKDCIETMRRAGADTFVSGRLDYHPMTDYPDDSTHPINLIEAGHFYTENPVCAALADIVRNIDADIDCDIFYSNTIKAI